MPRVSLIQLPKLMLWPSQLQLQLSAFPNFFCPRGRYRDPHILILLTLPSITTDNSRSRCYVLQLAYRVGLPLNVALHPGFGNQLFYRLRSRRCRINVPSPIRPPYTKRKTRAARKHQAPTPPHKQAPRRVPPKAQTPSISPTSKPAYRPPFRD